MKKAQIKRSWIVYPPHYRPGDGYFEVPFLKDAWNKACSLGVGAEVELIVDKTYRNGNAKWSNGNEIYVVEKRK